MKDWHKLKPERFKKIPYQLTGCDSYVPLPWSLRGLENSIAGDYQHPFWRALRPSKHVDFRLAGQVWKGLPEDTFSMYAEEAPAAWGTACHDIAAYLATAVQHIDEVIEAIERARQL